MKLKNIIDYLSNEKIYKYINYKMNDFVLNTKIYKLGYKCTKIYLSIKIIIFKFIKKFLTTW